MASSSLILGATPIKTSSTRKLRRALFATPISAVTPVAATLTSPNVITPETSSDTIVKYAETINNARKDTVAVV